MWCKTDLVLLDFEPEEDVVLEQVALERHVAAELDAGHRVHEGLAERQDLPRRRHPPALHQLQERRKGLFNNALNTFYIIHRLSTSWTNERRKGLFNNTLNTFYIRLYGVRHVVKDQSESEREETRCHHIGYSFWLAARVLLYASSYRQDNTYHGLWYTSREIAQWVHHKGSIWRPIAPWVNALTTELPLPAEDKTSGY